MNNRSIHFRSPLGKDSGHGSKQSWSLVSKSDTLINHNYSAVHLLLDTTDILLNGQQQGRIHGWLDLLQQSFQQVWIHVVRVQFDMNPCSTQRFLGIDPVIMCLCEKHETPESAAMTTICNYLLSWLAFYQQRGLMTHLCSWKVLWSNLLCRTWRRRRRWKLLCCK